MRDSRTSSSAHAGPWKRAALRGALLVLALLLMEAVCRGVFRGLTTTTHASFFSLRWQDSIAGERNANGFRDKEVLPHPEEGVFRICVIGDSFTFGQGLPRDARLTEIMEAWLNRRTNRFEIVNLGVDGAQTEDHVRILRDHALPLHPDFVLLQWFVNDVETAGAEPEPRPRRILPWRKADRFLTRHSALWSFAEAGYSRLQFALGSGETYWDYVRRLYSDDQSDPSVRARLALDEFFDLCRANGIESGVVMYPDLVTDLGPAYPLGFLMDRVAAQLAEKGVKTVDLRKTFLHVPENGATLLWVNRFDSHPSRWANELAAEAVLDAFGADWINRGSPPRGY